MIDWVHTSLIVTCKCWAGGVCGVSLTAHSPASITNRLQSRESGGKKRPNNHKNKSRTLFKMIKKIQNHKNSEREPQRHNYQYMSAEHTLSVNISVNNLNF